MSSPASTPLRFNLILALVLAIVAVVFALQNTQLMTVNLVVYETQGSTALILILTFGLGVLVGLISTLPSRLRARRRLRELEQRQGEMEASASSKTTPSWAQESEDTSEDNSS